ncbi:MAG: hypothetical protein H0X29_02100 [Parachlamydiaceae bacterium]|nr:hypothetical protein [Parachlamydiaceae bacterium]
MQSFPPTYVLRHRRENLKKCSLRGLESRPDFDFFSYPNSKLPDISNYIMLDFEGPVISPADSHLGLFILDATWRYAEKMVRFVDDQVVLERRSLPPEFRTAYPRRQEDCSLPERGLASIEAIYIAYWLMGRETARLLENYHWKTEFMENNKLLKIN